MSDLLRFDVGHEDAPLRGALTEAIARVLERGRYLFGPETEAFEAELAAWLAPADARAAVAVGSGTDALTVALLALGVGPGDEVVTVANAGVPGPTAIRRTGADVVFCDVVPETCLMDPRSAREAAGPRTRALLPVHLYGGVVDVEALRDAVPGVPVVEDCAQAVGSRLHGRAVGTLGDVAAFSFYPTKNLGALGDAGMVLGAPALVNRARRVRDYGRDEDGQALEVGTMSRMDELQAAALRVKLSQLDASLAKRRALMRAYDDALPSAWARVGRGAESDVAANLYVVRSAARAGVRAALERDGIGTGIHYARSAHRMPAFAGARRTSLDVSERACTEVLSLPFFPSMSRRAVARVCASLEAAC